MTIPIPSQAGDFASDQEAIDALTNMSPANLMRLKQSARLRSAGLTAVDWNDLVSEAVSRILSGSRRWPRSVPFVAFMIQTVRSIASEEWRRIHHEPVVLESSFFSAEFDGMPALSDVATTSISPEREAIARQTLQEIVEIFANDSVALAVLLGLAKGLTPDEVQSTSNLTATQYASAQKRIRRLLARRFPLGDIS